MSPIELRYQGGCELVSGGITGWGSGTIGVAVSKDGTPDSALLGWELFCKMSSTIRLTHHLGELGKSVMGGVVPVFQIATFALASGHVQER